MSTWTLMFDRTLLRPEVYTVIRVPDDRATMPPLIPLELQGASELRPCLGSIGIHGQAQDAVVHDVIHNGETKIVGVLMSHEVIELHRRTRGGDLEQAERHAGFAPTRDQASPWNPTPSRL